MVRKAKKSATNGDKAKQTNDHSEQEQEEAVQNKESPFLADCNKAFQNTDFYSILTLDKTKATQNDIKKAYYRLSLRYHPDKCTDESLKEECKFKFQLLGKIYSILSDEEKKKLYDECGLIDGEEELFGKSDMDWDAYWHTMFKKVTEEDIVNFFKEYKNSPQEREDLLNIYEKHKGNLTKIIEEMISEDSIVDEERFKKILGEAIEKKEIESFEAFVNEDKKKAAKRKAKYEKEAEEAEQLKKEKKLDDTEASLKAAILQNAERRKNQTEDLLSRLEEKFVKNAKKGGNQKKTKAGKKKQDDSDDEDVENLNEESDEDENEDAEDDNDDDGEDEESEEDKKKKKPKRTSSIIKNKPTARGKPLKSKPSIKKKVKRL